VAAGLSESTSSLSGRGTCSAPGIARPSPLRDTGRAMSALICANAVTRLVYGAAALTAPSRPLLGKVALAPDTEQFPEARLFVRGFASHQLAVALLGLASLTRSDLRRPALTLAAVTDAADIASAVIEARSRSGLDADLSGGIAFSSAGLVSALVALSVSERS
jgi:hypothetical protein